MNRNSDEAKRDPGGDATAGHASSGMRDAEPMLSESRSRRRRGPCTIIGAPAPSSAGSKQRCGRATAPRLTRSRPTDRKPFDDKTVRLEDRGHQRGRPEAHQCRRPDGRPHPGRDRHRRWRHGFDGGKRNARRRAGIRLSHGASICRRDRSLTPCRRCSTRSTRCIRRSRFRIRALRISSAPASRADHRRQCLRASVRARRAGHGELARARSRRGKARHHDARRKQFIGHGKNVLGDPRIALDLARQRIAPARRDAAGRRGGDHRHLSSAAADPGRRLCAADFGVLGRVSVGFE